MKGAFLFANWIGCNIQITAVSVYCIVLFCRELHSLLFAEFVVKHTIYSIVGLSDGKGHFLVSGGPGGPGALSSEGMMRCGSSRRARLQ